jgi:hypothetical protein
MGLKYLHHRWPSPRYDNLRAMIAHPLDRTFECADARGIDEGNSGEIQHKPFGDLANPVEDRTYLGRCAKKERA